MHSCIYEGRVSHGRTQPVQHRFRYPVFLMYLDLDELDEVFEGRWFWSAKRPALASFRRSDYLGPAQEPLAESVRRLVQQRTGRRPRGPIRLLTHLRYFGYCFNPVSYYYCFDDVGGIEAIVAEVSNTPWGERTCYVLSNHDGAGDADTMRFREHKNLHVSPFMPMAVEYRWLFNRPGERLATRITTYVRGQPVFGASLVLQRSAINARSLARVLLRYPAMTLRVQAAIHWQALRLWLKGCPVHAHPRKQAAVAQSHR